MAYRDETAAGIMETFLETITTAVVAASSLPETVSDAIEEARARQKGEEYLRYFEFEQEFELTHNVLRDLFGKDYVESIPFVVRETLQDNPKIFPAWIEELANKHGLIGPTRIKFLYTIGEDMIDVKRFKGSFTTWEHWMPNDLRKAWTRGLAHDCLEQVFASHEEDKELLIQKLPSLFA
jgi:hypothetical protein